MPASIEIWLEGSQVKARATWLTESVPASLDYDTPTDPTTVTFTARQRKSDGTMEDATEYVYDTDSEVARIDDGVFELTIVPTPGRWYLHAQGTDAAYGSARATFEIDASEALAA
jgi:hypothetical protein